jgi:hypothetical protein
MSGPWIAIMLLIFLAVVLAAGGGAARTGRRQRPARPTHHPATHLLEDTNPDDIADETTPSRSDD